jgi:hypothetical protein
LALLLLLFAQLIKLLFLFESFLFLQPDPLLVLQEERVPGFLHIQVSATHLD